MADKTEEKLPQVGSGTAGESHPSISEGRPTDSGGDNLPCVVGAKVMGSQEHVPVLDRSRRGSLDSGAETVGEELDKTKEFLRTIITKRKLRADLEGTRSSSAPTSPNVSCIDLTWCEEEATSKRFKSIEGEGSREKVPRTSSQLLATKVRAIIKNIAKEVASLSGPAMERNTKREIKEIFGRLNSLSAQIMTDEMQALLQSMGRAADYTSERLSTSQTEEAEDTITRLEEKVAQQERAMKALEERVTRMEFEKDTAVSEVESLKAQNLALTKLLKDSSRTVTIEVLDNIEEYSNFELLEKKDWPEKIFKTAFITKGHPLKSKGRDLLVTTNSGITQGSAPANEVLYKSFLDRYPELEGMEGRLPTLTVTTKTEDLEGCKITDRWIVKAEMEDANASWYGILQEVKDKMVRGDRRDLAIYPPLPDPAGERTRKMAESIFRNSGIKVIIFTRGRAQNSKGGEGVAPRRAWKRKDEDVLILNKEGCSYADLLRNVKDNVKPGTKAAEGIRKIKEAKNGQMIIVIEKRRKDAVDALKRVIERDSNATLRAGRGEKTTVIMIRDIDGLATQDEVLEALAKETGLMRDNIKVGNMRKSYGGNQAVTVRLPQRHGLALANKGIVKIGLNDCLVKERVDPNLCFRCWQYGHRSNQCGGPDRSDRCMRCGGTGHAAKTCNVEKSYCLTCRLEGHTTMSKGCPEFQKTLEAVRGKRMSGRRTGMPAPRHRQRTGSEASASSGTSLPARDREPLL